MKRHFVFILTSVILLSSVFSQEYDIRKLKWGMSYEEVQQAEQLDTNFYKSEDLLGMKVEVLFGCDNKGLYSVTYSTPDKLFAGEALKVMKGKYGEPKSDLDYNYLIQVKDLLKANPEAVILAFEKGDFSGLVDPQNPGSGGSEKKIIKNALTKRYMWEFSNTTALLLDSIEGGALTYWSKTHHYESKKKFNTFMEELKKLGKKTEKPKKDEGEKF